MPCQQEYSSLFSERSWKHFVTWKANLVGNPLWAQRIMWMDLSIWIKSLNMTSLLLYTRFSFESLCMFSWIRTVPLLVMYTDNAVGWGVGACDAMRHYRSFISRCTLPFCSAQMRSWYVSALCVLLNDGISVNRRWMVKMTDRFINSWDQTMSGQTRVNFEALFPHWVSSIQRIRRWMIFSCDGHGCYLFLTNWVCWFLAFD